MYTPYKQWSSEVLLDLFGLYLHARLNADPATHGLATIVDKAQSSLRIANERERKAFQVLQFAIAERDHAVFALRRTIVQIEGTLWLFVGKNRGDNTYRMYFPVGLTPVLESPLAEMMNTVGTLEAALREAPAGFPLKPFLSKLTAAREALEKPEAALKAATIAHDQAYNAEVAERGLWLETYRAVFGELTKLFPSDRGRVDSYFRPGRKHKRAAGEGAAPMA